MSAGERLIRRPLAVELVDGQIRYTPGQPIARLATGRAALVSYVDEHGEHVIVACVRFPVGGWAPIGLLHRARAIAAPSEPRRRGVPALTPAMQAAIAVAESRRGAPYRQEDRRA